MTPRRKRLVRAGMTMTDIAFLLLLFFMVFAMISEQTPQQMTIVQVSEPLHEQEQQYRLMVLSDGSLYTKDGPIALDAYAIKIQEALHDHPEMTPVILADARTPYTHIASILDVLRSAGVEHVGFLADHRSE